MKVLVVGASGFVGRHLCKYLESGGQDVHAGVRTPGTAAPYKELVIGDLAAAASGADLAGYDAVVHLAARVHVMHDTSRDPLAEFRRANTVGTERLAAAAVAAGVGRFVYVSTVKVLGERTAGQPFRHDDRPAPCDPYSVSKLEAEQALRRIADESPMEAVVLRPPLVYGPGVGGNVLRAMKLVARRMPLPFGMLDNKRSMLGVTNLCDAIACALENGEAPREPLLVADGEDVSTREFFALLCRELGVPVRMLPVPGTVLKIAGVLTRRSGAVARLTESLQVDVSKTMELLDWTPPSTIEQEMSRMAEWFLKNGRER